MLGGDLADQDKKQQPNIIVQHGASAAPDRESRADSFGPGSRPASSAFGREHAMWIRLRSISFALAIALLAGTTAHAQSLRVTAANASNGQVYDVTFAGSGGYTTVLNTDQNLYTSLRSLVFIPNAQAGTIDLLVADTLKGEVIRYTGSAGVGTVIWSTSQGPGPQYPDGLSVDPDGDLFVISNGSGTSKPQQLWVLPHDPSLPLGAGFLAPRLIDASFNGIPVQSLDDTLIARTSSPAANAGDLLVLASSPDTVFVYSAASVQGVLAGGPPISPSAQLLTASQFPAGADLGGMDFWPPDGSLLITTSGGTILRYAFAGGSATRLPDFSNGLGNGKFKVKAGIENGVAYAFVANNNGGQILEFGAPPPAGGPNPPLAVVTSGVEHPQGLAVTSLEAAAASSCQQNAGGCDLLGKVLKHAIEDAPTLAGFLIEDICVVPVDPRIAQYGTCTGHTLQVGQVCAGYGTTVIPDYLCGGSGSTGSGFALVKTLTNSDSQLNGAFVANDADSSTVLPGANNPPCPQTVLAWAPLPGEGSVAEGNNFVEMTGTCGTSGAGTRQLSLWGLGLVVNMSALPGSNTRSKWINFASSKYGTLNATISAASIDPAFEATLQSCINTSQTDFGRNKFASAASQLLTCDSLVAGSPGSFFATSANPNPSGDIRGRLANLYMTINTRLLGNPPAHAWPAQCARACSAAETELFRTRGGPVMGRPVPFRLQFARAV
jgi:hypothetical protein